jgi:hypothetical protein
MLVAAPGGVQNAKESSHGHCFQRLPPPRPRHYGVGVADCDTVSPNSKAPFAAATRCTEHGKHVSPLTLCCTAGTPDDGDGDNVFQLYGAGDEAIESDETKPRGDEKVMRCCRLSNLLTQQMLFFLVPITP